MADEATDRFTIFDKEKSYQREWTHCSCYPLFSMEIIKRKEF
nr:MAG TPA: hypothetical protein [Caudoviricetes sp.]